MITVRQATPDDQEAIFAFIRQAYASRWQYKIPERWAWEFAANPYWGGTDPPVWIAVDEHGQVVGQAGAMYELLKIGDQLQRLAWGVDAFVSPDYRRQGVGTRLQEAHYQAHDLFMSLNMSPRIQGIKRELGSRPVDPVVTFIKVLRHDRDSVQQRLSGGHEGRAAGVFRSLGLDRATASYLNWRMDRRVTASRSHLDPAVEVRETAEIGPEFDELWEQISTDYYALVKRDRAYLRWKYIHQPHLKHKVLTAWREEQLKGYLILRRGRDPEPNLGILADVFVSRTDEQSLAALLVYAVEMLKERGCAAVVAGSSIPEIQQSLIRLDFREHKRFSPLLFCKPGLGCEEAFKPGRWLLAIGDHDWNQFPNARILFG